MTTTTKAKPLPASWLNALRAIAANDYNPMGRAGGVNTSVFRALEARGLVERKGVRMPLTAAGRALLASLDPAWGIAARLSDLGYADVRAVSTAGPAGHPDSIEVRGQVYPLRAVMVDGNTSEAALRIVAHLSGEDAAALASRGALPLFEVNLASNDDVDDRGAAKVTRWSIQWPAVSAERAREEATRWAEEEGNGAEVMGVEGMSK